MGRSKSSKQWLNEYFNDAYVKQSQIDGFRSRASYKLLELDKKDGLFRPGMSVVDLGAAPGGWSQVAAQRVGDKGTVVASDILPMDTIAGVDFICGDFTEASVFDAILSVLDQRPVDLVISDMAPNMSGMADIDQPRSMYLVELAVDFARQVLAPGSGLVMKVFQGEGADALMRDTRSCYSRFAVRKPGASRARSREVYWVAQGFKDE